MCRYCKTLFILLARLTGRNKLTHLNKAVVVSAALFLYGFNVAAADGIISVASKFDPAETMQRFESVLKNKGMKVFARVDHRKGAESVGLELRPTELILFGNPKAGSPLMQCTQSIALDLPQKALVWEDENGKVWLSYNDPVYLKNRHKVTGCDAAFTKIRQALAGMVNAAVSP